jgi:potassium-transporting ATPase KdpC subunit
MNKHVTKSLWLLGSTVVICCLVYPLVVWAIGQTFFPFTANGSMVTGPDGKLVGSLQIAQPFTKDEYFWPRPSAASYDGSASASSTLAASNYLLRDRVARMLGPIVRYASGAKKGQLAAPDVETWFQQDRYQGNPHIVAQWADNHNELAQSWVSANPSHAPSSPTGRRRTRPKWRIGPNRIRPPHSRNRRIWLSPSSKISPSSIPAGFHRLLRSNCLVERARP